MASAIDVARSIPIWDVIRATCPDVIVPRDRGSNIRCPFHMETNPSFHVYSNTNSFHCFSCGASGSPIDFYMALTGICEPVQAAEMLCDMFHLSYTKAAVDPKEQLYVDVYKYVEYLFTQANTRYRLSDGTFPIEYWKRRGIESLVDKYGLGYCPPAFLDKARNVVPFSKVLKAKFPSADPFAMGLVDRHGDCVFCDRYMFPIRDARGKTVAFSGRARDNSVPAKYKNTTETDYFKKRKCLYNYDVAKGYPDIIVVEGHVDALSLVACGVRNVVAAMGTAFTSEHLSLLETRQLYLSFDNDSAGYDKMFKLVKDFPNTVFRCMRHDVLGEYKDFNDALVDGVDCAQYVVKKNYKYGVDYALEYLKGVYDLSVVDNRKALYDIMRRLIANNAYGDVVNDYVLKSTRRLLGLPS